MAHFTGVFEDLDCDVLALQEGVSADQIRRVAEAMKCWVVTTPSPCDWPGHVLSRHPVLESRAFSHVSPNAPERPFSRTAGAVLLRVTDERLIWIVNIHLHPHAEFRSAEADVMAEKVGELIGTGCPIVVLGDFNSEMGEPIHQVLVAAGFVNAMADVGGGVQATMDTAGIKVRTIDHICVSGDLADRLKHAEVIRRESYRQDEPPLPGQWVHSDHLPVIATLDY